MHARSHTRETLGVSDVTCEGERGMERGREGGREGGRERERGRESVRERERKREPERERERERDREDVQAELCSACTCNNVAMMLKLEQV